MGAERGRVLEAAGLMLAYAGLVGLADNAVPGLARSMSLWQFLAIRAALALALLCGFAMLRPARRLRVCCWRSVMLRAWAHAAAIACFFAAMVTLTPPQALAALLTAPVFAVAIDAVASRRPPRPAALLAVGCGFAGVLLALPHGTAGAWPGLLLGLLAGALYALSNVMARRHCRVEDPLVLTATYLAATGVLGAAAMILLAGREPGSGFLTRAPVWPGGRDWAILCWVAAANLVGVTLMLGAYQRVEAAWAGTLHYLVLPASCFWSWALWGWAPRPAEAWGMALIAAAGVLVVADVGRLSLRARSHPAPSSPREAGGGAGPPGQAACFWPAKRS